MRSNDVETDRGTVQRKMMRWLMRDPRSMVCHQRLGRRAPAPRRRISTPSTLDAVTPAAPRSHPPTSRRAASVVVFVVRRVAWAGSVVEGGEGRARLETTGSGGFETLAGARSSTTEGEGSCSSYGGWLGQVRWLRRARDEPVSKPLDRVVSRRS